ncbi:MAG TPA: VOC family protein [Longimicrobiales bacterium]|nr:VOC family protein [Longimicrobiales bacterium]
MSDSPLRLRPRLVPLLGVGAGLLLGGVLTGFVLREPPRLSPRFNHVMLHVSDLDATIAFYTRAFDLQVTQRIDTLTLVAADGSEIPRPVRMALLKFPGQDFVLELSEQNAEAGGPPPFYQHLGVDVADIEAAAERVQAAGAREFSGVRTVRAPGGIEARNAFFLGPDGELVELMQMVAGVF